MRYRTATKYIAKGINLLIKFLIIFPNCNFKKKTIKKFERWRNRVHPNLFDNEEFLYYVYKKKVGFENSKNSIKTLVMRGSNSDYGFYPNLYEYSYNLGLTSSDLYIAYQLYSKNRNRLPLLNNIIVYFSVSSPGYSLIYISERYRAVAYRYFFNIPYFDESKIQKKSEKLIFSKCANLQPVKLDFAYKGYEKKTDYLTDIRAEDRVVPHLRENKRKPDQMYWLKRLVKLILSDNRKIFVVITPFRSDYKKLLPNQLILFEELYKIEGIEIINLFDSEVFSDEDFGDTDHFNEHGAKKCTQLLYNIIEKRNE